MAKPSVKEQVLNILHRHKGTSYSGQELAEQIGVSRTAVWKAIEKLRDEGYDIVGSTKLGYTMASSTDILDENIVSEFFDENAKAFYKVECFEEIDSTNNYIKSIAQDGAPAGSCAIAAMQTAGRGRRGRDFFSPNSTGLYLSVLLRPNLSIEDAVLITTAAAVAGVKACCRVCPQMSENLQIKWVNDIYLNDKKICGILTEGSLSMETGGLEYAVMGIGFNLCPPKDGWPDNIKDIAGSLFEDTLEAGTRNKLAGIFLNEFYEIVSKLPDVTYLDEYRSRQMAVGRMVLVLEADGSSQKANVIGVDDKCRLLVTYENESEVVALNSGEISVKI